MNKLNYQLREALETDIPKLLEFEQGVVEAERPFNSGIADQGVKYYDFQSLMESPQAILLVAELEGVLIASGYARIEKAKPYLKHDEHLYLGFMYVDPPYRGQGVNGALMRALISWGKTKGIREYRLDVYTKNSSAIQAYTKLGFKPLIVEMRLEA